MVYKKEISYDLHKTETDILNVLKFIIIHTYQSVFFKMRTEFSMQLSLP